MTTKTKRHRIFDRLRRLVRWIFDNDEHCPVCGYYCLGKGGYGCIDKPNASGETEETRIKL